MSLLKEDMATSNLIKKIFCLLPVLVKMVEGYLPPFPSLEDKVIHLFPVFLIMSSTKL